MAAVFILWCVREGEIALLALGEEKKKKERKKITETP